MSTARKLRELRQELGAPMHTDWTSRRILCERGDLVRDLEVETPKRVGERVFHVPPELWSAYQRGGVADADEVLTSWTAVAEYLGVSVDTVNRHRKKDPNCPSRPAWTQRQAREWFQGTPSPGARAANDSGSSPATRRGGGLTVDDLKKRRRG